MIALAVENSQERLQRAFAEAILFDDAPIPATICSASGPACASRFGVYRNNVIAGLINALAARYPVTRKLLWDDAFHAVARHYVVGEPPRSPVMFEYGDSFPQFLRSIGQGAASDYLADIAALEAARTRAYHAADATPLPRDALAAVAPEDLPELRLTLHPSAMLLASRFPLVSMWEAGRCGNDNIPGAWKPECALIARPHLQVEVRPLSPGVHAFMAALAEGYTLGAAIAKAAADHGDFDLGAAFDSLISAEIVIGVKFRRSDSLV
jgi:hypothetical protein